MGGDVEFRQQSGAGDAAADEEPVAGCETPEEMTAAEEFCRDRSGFVGEVDRDEREAARAFFDARYPSDRDRFAIGERCDRLWNAPIAVRARQIREQLLGRLDAEFSELRRRRRPDAGQARE
jgi:hypothetical protein